MRDGSALCDAAMDLYVSFGAAPLLLALDASSKRIGL